MAQSVRHVPAGPHRRKCRDNLPRRFSLGPHRIRVLSKLPFIHLILRPRSEHDHYFPPRPFLSVVLGQPRDRSALYLLELLRQLPRHGALPLARARLDQVAQRRPDTAGRFIQHARMGSSDDVRDRVSARATATLEKSEESEALGPEARGGERGEQRGGAGDGHDGDPGRYGRGHESSAGIRQQRRAGVRDERNVLPRGQPLEDLRRGLRLVVLVIRAGGRRHFVMVEQPARVARVLGQDDGYRAKNLYGAKRDVAEVSDRRADEIEPTRYAACSLIFASRAAFGTAPTT